MWECIKYYLGYPNASRNLAATNETLLFALTFATNHLPNGEEGVELIYETYPDLETDDVENRTRIASEGATAWWFSSGSFYEAEAHARSSIDKTILEKITSVSDFYAYILSE